MTLKTITTSVLLLLVSACGGGDGQTTQSNAPVSLSPPANGTISTTSSGQINFPGNQETFNTNLLLAISANNSEGIVRVALQFNQSTQLKVLCDSLQDCGNGSYTATVSGLNPGDFGAAPGAVNVSLLITDSNQQVDTVYTASLRWQPPSIDNIQVARSASGTEINISWSPNPDLLRYNIYLASQTGVNKTNYLQLPDGQALLAVNGGPQAFSGLSAVKDYYLLLTGVDGGGESTNINEIVIPASGIIPNSNPIATDDNATVDEDDTILINALENDTDIDGDPLSISVVSALDGIATIQSNQILFEPPLNFNGDTRIDYTIIDGNGGNASAQVFVIVNEINDAPIANDDFVSTQQDTAINIDVLANDEDIEGDSLIVESASGSAGDIVIEADNTITFDPAPGFTGTDSFDYTINDGNGGVASASVSIDVGLTSRLPIANPDNYIALTEQLLDVNAGQGLLVNDADPDGDNISVVVAPLTAPNSGTLNLFSDGSFTYQPNINFVGTDSFVYQIIADNGQTRSATVNIDVRLIPENLDVASTSISGDFLYLGRGERPAGSGIGSGLYRIGECLQDANTFCAMRGNYNETAISGNIPGQTGSYAFVQKYSGASDSPVLAVSRTPGSNTLSFNQIGDVSFEMFLFPDSGGVIKALYPSIPFENSLSFGAFIDTEQTCTGLPVGVPCNIGQVGLVDGSQLSAPLDRLTFNQPGGVFIGSQNASPQAVLDSYTVAANDTLVVNAPGLLANDSDPDTPIIGNNLEIISQFSPGIGALSAIGFDEFRQLIYSTNNFGTTVSVNNRLSAPVEGFPILGEPTNNVDIEIAPEAFQLAGTLVPQGTFLFINGETANAEIYAFDTETGVLIAQLNTAFGNGDVVGGAYNPKTQTFFLVTETRTATNSPMIAEISPSTGAVLNQFDGALDALDFDIGFGDLDVNNETGTLYIIGNGEINILELTATGSIVRNLGIPIGVTNPSGLAVNQSADRIWIASSDGDVYELAYENRGVSPQLRAELVVTTENGVLFRGNDGSFIYTPNAGFVGNDIFTYRIIDTKGKDSLNNVRITVTN